MDRVAPQVLDLLLGERPLPPVGRLVLLGEVDPVRAFDESLEADPRVAEERRRDHRVEHAREGEVVVAREDRDVVVPAVHHELRVRSRDDGTERRQVSHGERVDDRVEPRHRDLHDADALPELVERVGLGVERDARLAREPLAECRQRLGRRDDERRIALLGRHFAPSSTADASWPNIRSQPRIVVRSASGSFARVIALRSETTAASTSSERSSNQPFTLHASPDSGR